jgi:hypothetical protein
VKRSRIKSRPADNHLTGDEWAEVFQRLLERSGGLCEAQTPDCAAPGGSVLGMPRERVSIQHRRAQGMGGTALAETNTDLANLLVICGTGNLFCHGWIETQERGAARERGLWVPHDYRDGVAVPVQEYPLVLASGRRVLLDPVVPIYLRHPDEWGGRWLA